MFDKIAVQMAEVAAQCELKNAQNQHGQTFHSFHEAESVLHEEIVESKDYFSMMQFEYEKLFTALREQDWEAFLQHIRKIEEYAKFGAMELLQVQAVCKKALLSFSAEKGEGTNAEKNGWF